MVDVQLGLRQTGDEVGEVGHRRIISGEGLDPPIAGVASVTRRVRWQGGGAKAGRGGPSSPRQRSQRARMEARSRRPFGGSRLSPELDFARSVDGLRTLTEQAGLQAVQACELHWEWPVGVDALWRGIAAGVATVGQTFRAQAPRVRVAAEGEFRRAAGRVSDAGVLRFPSRAAYVVARRPR